VAVGLEDLPPAAASRKIAHKPDRMVDSLGIPSGSAKELMTVLAQKLGMSESALYLMADAFRHDDAVKFLYDLRHFDEIPPPELPAPPPAGDDRLEIR
jgi:hypothetical protein